MFLSSFARESCSLGVGRSRSHHGVQGTKLTQMFEVMHPFRHMLLQGLPLVETIDCINTSQLCRLLIMQQLHKHLTLCILIEYHLQICCHRQDLVHGFTLDIQSHQRHQTKEICVMSEAEVCTNAIAMDSCFSLCLYTLPE